MNIIKLPWEKERELNFIPIATGCGAFFWFFLNPSPDDKASLMYYKTLHVNKSLAS